MNPLTVLVGIKSGEVEALARTLSEINANQLANPIMRLGEDRWTHSARWTILTEPESHPRLLLTAEFDGRLDDYLDHLVETTPGLDEIWGHCEGYTGPQNFKSFIRANAYPTQAFYIAFPDETVVSIRDKIAARLRLEALLDSAPLDARHALAALSLLPRPKRILPAVQQWLASAAESFRRSWLTVALSIVEPLSQIGQTTKYTRVGTVGWDKITPRAQALKGLDGQMITVTTIKPWLYWRLRLALGLNEFLGRFGWAPGQFADVGTLHSFRWVLIDNNKRLLFISVFDGSWQNYMGDFIDKIVWALDGVYNNTKEYPKGGMADVIPFQRWILNRQWEPQLLYKAYPDETVLNLIRDRTINNTLSGILWDGLKADGDKISTVLKTL